jgi:hypothetical protein
VPLPTSSGEIIQVPADPIEAEKVPVRFVASGQFTESVGDGEPTEFVGRYLGRAEYSLANQYAVLLESSCVNKMFAEGSTVWCIPTEEVIGGLATNQYVHVVRISEENHMEEHSIRLLKQRPGRIELHPDSFDEGKQVYIFDSATKLQLGMKGRPFRLEIKGVAIAGIRQVRL